MRRKIVGILCLIGLTLGLGGCETCGNLAKFNLPSIPKDCQTTAPAK